MKAFREAPGRFVRLKRLLARHGITLLENESVLLNKSGIGYRLTGLADWKWGSRNYERILERKNEKEGHQIAGRVRNGKVDPLSAAGRKTPSSTLVLCHNPDTAIYLEKQQYQANWIFAGHFHGGQIWMPFHLEFRLFRREILCKKGITHGLHQVGESFLYINRGLGCVLFPFRFLSPPEITIADLPLPGPASLLKQHSKT